MDLLIPILIALRNGKTRNDRIDGGPFLCGLVGPTRNTSLSRSSVSLGFIRSFFFLQKAGRGTLPLIALLPILVITLVAVRTIHVAEP